MFYEPENWLTDSCEKNVMIGELPVNNRSLEKGVMLINILNRELEGSLKSLLIKCTDDTVFILQLGGRK